MHVLKRNLEENAAAELHLPDARATAQADTGAQSRRVALLTAVYPALSETFVYREVEGLSARGWHVDAVSLYELGGDYRKAECVEPADLTLLGSRAPRTLWDATVEALTHPLRALRTLATATRDAIWPGEPVDLRKRALLLGQAVLALGLAHWLRAREIRHIHCHFANGPATVGMYAALQLDLPFSFVGHANDIFDRRTLLVRKLQRASFVSCISGWHRDWYRSMQTGSDESYPVIRCGVDTEHWRRGDEIARPNDSLRILTVARLIPKKGIDTLIRGLDDAARRHQLSWHLSIVGEGQERSALENLCAELGRSEQVHFAGAVHNDRIRDYLGKADAFVLPCRTDELGDRDGIPVVLMEAMAFGVPVVVGRLPAIGELVIDGDTGLTIAEDDHAALADHLAHLARQPGERRRIGEAGRAQVKKEFALPLNLDRLHERLCAAIDGSAGDAQ